MHKLIKYVLWMHWKLNKSVCQTHKSKCKWTFPSLLLSKVIAHSEYLECIFSKVIFHFSLTQIYCVTLEVTWTTFIMFYALFFGGFAHSHVENLHVFKKNTSIRTNFRLSKWRIFYFRQPSPLIGALPTH